MKTKLFLLVLILCRISNSSAQAPNFDWAKDIGSSTIGGASGNSIALDDEGNLYATGNYSGNVDFDPGVGTYYVNPAALNVFFIAKYDTQGNFIWAKGIKSIVVGTSNKAVEIAVDSLKNIYVSGYFTGTIDFDPDSATAFNLTTNGNEDIFILKLDSTGNFVWAKRMGGANLERVFSMSIDKHGSVYTAGLFVGPSDFDPDSAGTFLMTGAPNQAQIFISKLDSSGKFVWAKKMASNSGPLLSLSSQVFGPHITIDPFGNVLATGEFWGTTDFNPDTASYNLTGGGWNDGDLFILKLDTAGAFLWAVAIIGSYDVFGNAIACDSMGNVYLTGRYYGTVDFDPGPGVFNLVGSSEGCFILNLSPAGGFGWARTINSNYFVNPQSLELDRSNNIFITGNFWGSADFNPGTGAYYLSSAGNNNIDIFICKLTASGNFAWAKSIPEPYADDFANDIAVDSIGNAYITGSFTSSILGFDAINLVNNFGSPQYAKMDMFIAKVNNSNSTEIYDREVFLNLSISPNPATNQFTISSPDFPIEQIEIYNLLGERVYINSPYQIQKTISTDLFSSGIYTLRITTITSIETRKLVIEK